jgi:uncharacterized protein (TIGR02757 family)
MSNLKKQLEKIYSQYNQRKYVDPDPLLFLYDYNKKQNREIAGFIAASLAYGRVEQIVKIVATVLEKLKPTPHDYLKSQKQKDIEKDFKNFQYRFAKDNHFIDFLLGIKQVLSQFDSLENCFYEKWASSDDTVLSGLDFLCEQICKNRQIGHLIADPKKSSACKRSMLYLRWMVRDDCVDPGGWEKITPSQLIVPLDTHMHKIGVMLGFTQRKSADMKTALEITSGFKKINRDDPVKYDFSLTRFGIQRDMNIGQLTRFIHNM